MRLLVCGGRNFANSAWLNLTLDELHSGYHFSTLIEGGAKGADRLAREWATAAGIAIVTFEADWMGHGRRAGPERNLRMLREGRPDVVVAFPGGRGTKNMVDLAHEDGVTVHVFEENANTIALGRTSL